MGFPVPGGGCYFCLDWGRPDPTGYIRQLHLNRTLIRQQLATARQNGQERLAWVICFFAGGNSYALDSTEGKLTSQDAANLYDAALMAQDLGFVEQVIEMDPQWSAAWPAWPDASKMAPFAGRDWQPEVYAHNMAFTLRIAETMDKTKVFYRMDLHAELDPVNPISLRYGQRLWQDWCAQRGGNDNSCGFSIWPPANIEPWKQFYGDTGPAIYNVHLYPNPPRTVAQMWADCKSAFAAAGLPTDMCLIGESCTDDPETDAALAADPTYFYRLVWPTGPHSNAVQDRLTINEKFKR